MNCAGGALLTIVIPQLDMQPKVSFLAVPGGPVLVSMQKSTVLPHCPHYVVSISFTQESYKETL